MPRKILNGLLIALCLTLSLPVFAHRVNVFAYTEGRTVQVESGFVGGGPAMYADITATTPDGKEVFAGKTDKNGKLSFPLPADLSADSLKIVINAGEGHRNEWNLVVSSKPKTIESSAPQPPSDSSDEKKYSQAELDAAVNETKAKLEKEVIEPMKKQLSATQNKEIGLSDIVGGIGWLIGIAGILAWWHSRRRKV